MDSLLDRFFWLSLGCFIGYSVSQLKMIKLALDDVQLARGENKKNVVSTTTKSSSRWGNILLIFVIFLTAWAPFVSQKASNDVKTAMHKDILALCQHSQDNRDRHRKLTDQVYILTILSVKELYENHRLTPIERKQANNTINEANEFRKQMYQDLKPSKACKSYSTDANVVPPVLPQGTLY